MKKAASILSTLFLIVVILISACNNSGDDGGDDYEITDNSVITISSITGITAPSQGETPVSVITETEQFTGIVSWLPDNDLFNVSTVYTATITLTAKSGYTFTGITEDFFTVAGATSVSNAADSGVVTATFPETGIASGPSTVTTSVINGIIVPAYGNTPVIAVTETEEFTGVVSWLPGDVPFNVSTVYTATITLTLKSGYTLTGITENFFTVAGATSVSNAADSGVVTAVFPETGISGSSSHSFVDTFGAFGYGEGQFQNPKGMARDGSGNIYIADQGNHKILKFRANSHDLICEWGSLGSDDDELNNPIAISVAYDQGNQVYVADSNNHRIVKFESSGTFMRKWGELGINDGEFRSPRGILEHEARVYVADTDNNRIQVFTELGIHVATFGSAGSGNGQFSSPIGIAIDDDDNIYISDCGNNRIQKFDSDYNYLDQWGTLGFDDGELFYPMEIEFDNDSIFVVDNGNNRIQKFDTDGNYLFQWGTGGTGNGEFNEPFGICITVFYILISDTRNFRIQRFRD